MDDRKALLTDRVKEAAHLGTKQRRLGFGIQLLFERPALLQNAWMASIFGFEGRADSGARHTQGSCRRRAGTSATRSVSLQFLARRGAMVVGLSHCIVALSGDHISRSHLCSDSRGVLHRIGCFRGVEFPKNTFATCRNIRQQKQHKT